MTIKSNQSVMNAYDYEELRAKYCQSIHADCDICPLSKMKDGCSPFDEHQIMYGERVEFLQQNILQKEE